MESDQSILEALSLGINRYEEGDVLQMAQWITLLDQWASQGGPERRSPVDALQTLIRTEIQEGPTDTFLEALGEGLDALTRSPAPDSNLWSQHGPAFLTETKNRLARAQELVLTLEERQDPELLGELFRVFHTIKGEAGFLHRTDLATLAHGTEELLDDVRSHRRPWDRTVADLLLQGIDRLTEALSPREARRDPGASSASVPATTEEVLRVPAAKIDTLVSQVGELLVALDSEAGSHSPTVKKLSRGLQQTALRLRTEPLHDLMGRLRRGARDLAQTLGKPLEITVTGQDLELDRNLIAALEEPMMHLIRNALDHGLEAPGDREARGKAPAGHLRLEARRKGNRIQIVVADDGLGLNTDRIWTKALDQGLVSGDKPTDVRTIHQLIFRPGFSTAHTLTQVSGRGVGMDIVASAVRSARGQVDVTTSPGQGTEIRLSFPLSTAVVDGLVVRLDQRRFVIPVQSVRESLKIAPGALRTVAPGSRVLSLRGEPLSVLSLRALLDGDEGEASSWGVVVETVDGGRQVLLVDDVETKKEAVIRSLGPGFQHLKGVSAATVLAGGRLALVLDVDQLVALGREAVC